jgi:hypothetical protein
LFFPTWPDAEVGEGGAAGAALDGDASGLRLDAGGGHHDPGDLHQLANAIAFQIADRGADLVALESHVDVLQRLVARPRSSDLSKSKNIII